MGRSSITEDHTPLDGFQLWIKESEPGDTISYHTGANASENLEVANFFTAASKRGEVFLFQKRQAFGTFTYYARRLSKRAGKILSQT